ncbi:baseplate J/gp47 family protein [uncultured Draconibacterium sp.]|uniref:baseplate J/gp47 family protein n=1 Tax=uncultured Draconibacterium sp. TaxID=1573823 RepID=UPI00326063D3
MNCGKDILLKREGSEQSKRFNQALAPNSFNLNDFELKQWMLFAWNFAKHVNYFSSTNNETADGNWQAFFKAEKDIQSFLNSADNGGTVSPHLALFVAFIKLIDTTKNRFNKLTKRHLDFYYQQILQIQKKKAEPDKVYLLFELAKNAVEEQLKPGTLLDGGKAPNGNKRVYKTTTDFIANQVKIAHIKSVYNDHENEKIKAAGVANSYDGQGAKFENEDIKWWPFGYYETPPLSNKADLREYPELPDARIGFAFSGNIFELQEGERNVQLSMTFARALESTIVFSEIENNIEIFLSGEKGWLGPFQPMETIFDANDIQIYSSELNTDRKHLKLAFRIPKEENAIVAYDSAVHGENFEGANPVCRVLLKTENSEAHRLYRKLLSAELTEFSVGVYVRAFRKLKLSNDIGSLLSDKPFYPFGTQPVKKSKFYIDCPEVYQKNWEKLQLNIEWKNTPDDFKTWYYAYRNDFANQISANDYLNGIGKYLVFDGTLKVTTKTRAYTAKEILEKKRTTLDDKTIEQLMLNADATFNWKINTDPSNLIVENDAYFTSRVELKEREDWLAVKDGITLFNKQSDGLFYLNLEVENPSTDQQKSGPLRLSLNEHFWHNMYPRIYALAMSSEEENALIPNEPYTPFVEAITLDYSASAKTVVELSNKNYYSRNEITLFHEYPFGQKTESITAKLKNDFINREDAVKIQLMPVLCMGGEMYIGLENAKAGQTISLLFQVLEGSEDPLADSFEGNQKVEWWVLSNNEWKALSTNNIISNNTDNLLKSGILKFILPNETSEKNTLLPVGFSWIRARIHKSYNAVAKVIGVYAQACEAAFTDNNNELSHLQNGLEAGTISKLIKRNARVKSVNQPFNSFGGTAHETDASYYQRVSERLRHKNRAITIWDYEHLVLQQFPQIHKVKCLSHTYTGVENGVQLVKYLKPGNVCLVVVPDIVNRNVFDIYQPRVSRALLNEIRQYIAQLSAPLVNVQVVNPNYEEVRIDVKVKFNEGFDESFYKNKLKNDLTALLSPWAFDSGGELRFGQTLHKSIVVNFIENLSYIDFVTHLKLWQKMDDLPEKEVVNAVPAHPMSILVSSKEHQVDTAEDTCSNLTIKPAETCQK